MVAEKKAEIAIIGGSGLYEQEMFENAEEIKVYTPFGKTSDTITIGKYFGKTVVFLPRHASGHQIPPHKINFTSLFYRLIHRPR